MLCGKWQCRPNLATHRSITDRQRSARTGSPDVDSATQKEKEKQSMQVLIVGAGLYGAVCAHELTSAGHTCHVIEKRDHIGGNIFTRYVPEAGCHEHVYGAHIFHTNSKRIWDFMNQFADFNHYVNRVKVAHDDQIYSFPINLFTLYQVFGVRTPEEARTRLAADIVPNAAPANMEEYCFSVIGPTLYKLFIEGYTLKQWGRHPRELPADAVKRLPVRLTFDDNYFNDRYQGIPIGGYTAIVEKMLDGTSRPGSTSTQTEIPGCQVPIWLSTPARSMRSSTIDTACLNTGHCASNESSSTSTISREIPSSTTPMRRCRGRASSSTSTSI
jgi:hypothetical protein